MGSPGSTAPSRGGDEPSPLYVPFALARAEVAKALGYPEDAAAEWLRGEAVAGCGSACNLDPLSRGIGVQL